MLISQNVFSTIFVTLFHTFHETYGKTCVEILTVNVEYLSSVSAIVSQGDGASDVLSVVFVGQHGRIHVDHVCAAG